MKNFIFHVKLNISRGKNGLNAVQANSKFQKTPLPLPLLGRERESERAKIVSFFLREVSMLKLKYRL